MNAITNLNTASAASTSLTSAALGNAASASGTGEASFKNLLLDSIQSASGDLRGIWQGEAEWLRNRRQSSDPCAWLPEGDLHGGARRRQRPSPRLWRAHDRCNQERWPVRLTEAAERVNQDRQRANIG